MNTVIKSILIFTISLIISGINAYEYPEIYNVNYIKIKKEMFLRKTPNFIGRCGDCLTVKRGSKAQVLQYDFSLELGVGIKVIILEPKKDKGKSGWVYYATNRASDIDVYNIKKQKVILQEGLQKDFFETQALRLKEDYEKTTGMPFPDLQEGNQEVMSSNYTKKAESNILSAPIDKISVKDLETNTYLNIDKNIKGFFAPEGENAIYAVRLKPGNYKIDQSKINLNGIIPLKHTVIHNGKTYESTIYLTQGGDQINPSTIIGNSIVHYKCDPRLQNPKETKKVVTAGDQNWHPGCQVLSNKNAAQSDKNNLSQCYTSILNNLRAKMGNTFNREKFLSALYTELNPKEQDFFSLILTTHGEVADLGLRRSEIKSLGRNLKNEMIMVMKVMENRAKNASARKNEKINNLDIALQPYQFSMYNASKSPKSSISLLLKGRVMNPYMPTVGRIIDSYLEYKVPPPPAYNIGKNLNPDKVYHYVAQPFLNSKKKQKVKKWYTQNPTIDPLKVDNTSMMPNGKRRHVFYYDLKWGYRSNEFKEASKRGQ